ncbi:MAG: UDP-2,4-diacetamido-2,4,6-trideoxy-beta-L-altropyranose hydrolase [Bacteriovoracia bacterium]
MKVLVRADASALIGTGHLMRCLTLALKLREGGHEVTFVARHITQNLAGLLAGKNFPLKKLGKAKEQNLNETNHSAWLGVSVADDAEETGETVGGGFDWVVVDHYALNSSWHMAARKIGKKIMVIDDLGDRMLDADLLLDQNFYAAPLKRYAKQISQSTKCLLGPEFALLREEFALARQKTKLRTGKVGRILIFYGGIDSTGETLKAAEAAADFGVFTDIVVGSSNPQLGAIRAFCGGKSNFRLHTDVTNMADLMAGADFSFGAGGTSTWERCALGLPALVTTVAENQEVVTKEAAVFGVQWLAGSSEIVTAELLRRKATELFQRPRELADCSALAMKTVDTKGSARVVEAMVREQK